MQYRGLYQHSTTYSDCIIQLLLQLNNYKVQSQLYYVASSTTK
jgi:hypothetical protein